MWRFEAHRPAFEKKQAVQIITRGYLLAPVADFSTIRTARRSKRYSVWRPNSHVAADRWNLGLGGDEEETSSNGW